MQTRWLSFIEACINTLIGFFVSISANIALFLLLGIQASASQYIWLATAMTALSIIRGYYVRRLFNSEFWKRWKRHHGPDHTAMDPVYLSNLESIRQEHVCERTVCVPIGTRSAEAIAAERREAREREGS